MQIQNSQTTFSSTYRIPLVEQNISAAKREALKKLASKYQNNMYPNGNQGNVRLSIRKRLGFKVFQKFEKHNVPKTNGIMDDYIKKELKNGNYKQFGKQKQ